ncbi:MAG TPA: DNA repair protein RecO [Kiritimatiellia bacterium]|nr:DNA repair protein RecO [Kiritimatiellia bacterium]
MIIKTPAIVLRQHPYTETSRVITWLTPDEGRLNTLIKGAMRPKSAFLGQIDLFYTCELLYYGRNRDGLPATREVTPLQTRERLRGDWRACAVASYLCSLVSRATPEKATQHDVFNWLEAALDDVAAHGASSAILCWHELRLLDLLGHAPQLRACRTCGAPATETGERAFSAKDGVWWCPDCAAREARRDLLRVPADTVRRLGAWQEDRSPARARAESISFSTLAGMERLLGAFIAYQLDIPPGPRIAALDILSRNPAQPVDRAGRLR